jgi:hypothetical protein
MTDGEMMVWAAAFALELQRVKLRTLESPDGKTANDHAKQATMVANAAVIALRFGAPEGEFRNAMVEQPWPPAGEA